MSKHHFDPSTNTCDGCGLDASTWTDTKPAKRVECPAERILINDPDLGLLRVVFGSKLHVSNAGGPILSLEPKAAKALGSFINSTTWSVQ